MPNPLIIFITRWQSPKIILEIELQVVLDGFNSYNEISINWILGALLKHKWIIFIALTTLSLVSFIAYEAYMVSTSIKKVYDPSYMESAPLEDRLKSLHYTIKYPIGDHHDAYIYLIEIGTEESLYYLEKRAKSYRIEDNTICTASHCFDAIKSIKERIEKNSILKK